MGIGNKVDTWNTTRGWYATWRCRRIVCLGWHPFVRLNTGGTCRPAGGTASFGPCRPSCPSRERAGAGPAPRFSKRAGKSSARCKRCGRKAIKTPADPTDLPPEGRFLEVASLESQQLLM